MEHIAEVIVAFTLGALLSVGATLTKQQQHLCAMMGGVWTPQPLTVHPYPPNICVGGKWLNVLKPRAKPA